MPYPSFLQIVVFGLMVATLVFRAQSVMGSEDEEQETIVISGSPISIANPVLYLERPPAIDGILGPELEILPINRFTRVIKAAKESSAPEVNYRLAYGTDFFYVFVEAEAESLTFRDRAYQNGDGFHMVLAAPRPGHEPTDEFYVLACSAVDKPRMEWTRRVFWYYNVNDIFVRTSEDAKLEFRAGDGKISFELLLPWRDVHPYHPWISEGIGFNLRFVKATEPDGHVVYDVVHDDCIGCELHPRHYALLQFEEPTVKGESQTFVAANRGHISEGDSLVATAVTATGSPGEETVTAQVLAGEGNPVAFDRVTYAIDPGFTRHSIHADTRRLPAGGYKFKWQSSASDAEGEAGLTILPPFDPNTIHALLEGLSANLAPSSLSTLEFKLEEVAAQIDSAKPYETCLRQRFRLARLEREIEEAIDGRDPYSDKTGFVRKAYRSEVDSSLQPYMVSIPDDFQPERTYPLFVYLHGSASTEYNLMGRGVRRMTPEGFIALAPRGRGTSNCFTFDRAQKDIAEAIDAVITDYPIDTARILLCGFSMGGYGVYRTFYESPEKFRALAIFSGHPDMANEWYPGNDYPDFTSPDLLPLFRDIPIFVFHGERDRNVSYATTEAFVTLLQQAGAQVRFHTEADKGHEEPSEETFKTYHNWVHETLPKPAGR